MTENQLKYLTYQESRRHNLATEGLGVDTLGETKRANTVRETETERANRASESLTGAANQIKASEAAIKATTAASDQTRKWVDLFWPF